MKIPYLSISVFFYFLLLLWGDFFSPGVLYLLDYGFTPHASLDWTYSLGISFTQVASLILGPMIASKLIFVLVLLAASHLSLLFSRRVIEYLDIRSRLSQDILVFLGIIFFTINPFAYERMMVQPMIYAGIIALGYGIYFLFFFEKYLIAGIAFGIALALFPHASFMILLIVGIYTVFFLRKRKALLSLGVLSCFILLLNLNWLIAPSLGITTSIDSVETFSSANQKAFETQALAPLEVISTNLLLYGFWGELYGNHFARVDFLSSLWYIGGFAILVLVVIGTVILFRKGQGRILASLGIIGFIALILGVGIASPLTAPLTEILYEYIPLFRGYREPQKWIGLLVIIYGLLFLSGIGYILKKYKNDIFIKSALLVSTLVLLFVWSPGPIPGYHGQLRNTVFPPEYETLRSELLGEKSSLKILALPWHLYIGCSWIGPMTVGNPIAGLLAPLRVVVSDNIEVADILYSNSVNPESLAIEKYLAGGDIGLLSPYGFTHILLMKQCAQSDTTLEFLENQVSSGVLLREEGNDILSLYRIEGSIIEKYE